MSFLTDKNLLKKAKFVGKILIVFILSVLLFAPTPALALDYNGTLQSYVSNTKVEIDGVLTSIKKLSTLSYENGKTTLAEVDNKLNKIQTDAGNNAEYFKNLSNNYQISYDNKLKSINQLYSVQKEKRKALWDKRDEIWNKFGYQNRPVYKPEPYKEAVLFVEPKSFKKPDLYYGVKILVPDKNQSLVPDYNDIYLENDGLPGYYQQVLTLLRQYEEISDTLKAVDNLIKQYEEDNQNFSKVIVLTNKISNLCDNLEKRINLAKQKAGNVKEYADALRSFSDPDILSEISELDQLVADLTKNLLLG